MREIKFRAWDKENSCWFEPTYEAYKGQLEELNIDLSGRLALRTIDKFADESTFPDRFELMQYTGLNLGGKEVYESDIISNGLFTFVVEYGLTGFVVNDADNQDLYNFADEDYKVIGNIYESKELLK